MFLTPWSSRAPSSPGELAETGPAFEPDGPVRFLLAQLCYEDDCHFPHLENTVAPVWTAEHGVRMFVVFMFRPVVCFLGRLLKTAGRASYLLLTG
jgi:hypothetical protein